MLDSAISYTRDGLLLTSQRASRLPWLRLSAASTIVLGVGLGVYPLLPRAYTSLAAVLYSPSDDNGQLSTVSQSAKELDDNAIQTAMDVAGSEAIQRQIAQQAGLLDDSEFNQALQPSVLYRLRRAVKSLLPPEPVDAARATAEQLSKALVIKRDKKSYLLRIGYQSRDPDKAAVLSNQLASAFVAADLARKKADHDAILAGLNQRITDLMRAYLPLEQREHATLVSSGLIQRAQITSLVQQMGELSKAAALAHTAMVQTTSRADMLLAAQRNNSLDSVSEALSSKLLQDLRERLIGFTTGAGSGASGAASGANNAVVAELRQAIGVEQLRIVRAAQNDASAATQTATQLSQRLATLSAQMTTLQAAERDLQTLSDQVSTLKTAVFLARSDYNAQISKDQVLQSNVKLIAPAVAPLHPSSPNTLLYIAFVLALLALVNGSLIALSNRAR